MTPRRAVNRTYDEIAIGDSASETRTLTADDLVLFAHASGNLNPIHLPGRQGEGDDEPAVAPGMWIAALFSSVLGNRLPGPGTRYRSQSVRFLTPARVGDTLTTTVTAKLKLADSVIVFDGRAVNQRGEVVAEAEAEVVAPARRVTLEDAALPRLALHRQAKFDALIAACAPLAPVPTAVAHPCDGPSLAGALEAAKAKLIVPILVGPPARIEAAAASTGLDLSGIEIVATPHSHASAARAVELVHEDRARAVMKGALHSDELLAEIVKREGGLRTKRRISHAFVLDAPVLDHLLIVTDAAINILPDLMTKADITQNAIDLARAIGIAKPKVAVMSAIETVNPSIPSSVDAAVLSKMADRGQITGGLVDGPLAMDNAIDLDAARTKGITSLVAGRAEILVVPNLEAGNMLAKNLTFVAQADAAGLVLGAAVPVMLTSRADDVRARLASAALAVLYRHWQTTGVSAVPGTDGTA
ncbi:bifunctional enoyl-CoA hydratase/phosphate acetyltransferase [Elioraea sp. Yellowstone]|uniref:bifunctional enoyl-CoA hydratase/phosphate acetyltransferase n=1 Tax=Elioraea sp. Yellowstone TaxID=2592070 RepID=UPI0011536EA5|nr:bifunctional enoyl-CoA hydratase/phosphate acetyltransferase [Elioraea sp. Yellowstone]TQF83452.1 bifunctional enoyl-CoA hydratase/phosphate acetyltransferase [Elioraea sp. Yellowstone]